MYASFTSLEYPNNCTRKQSALYKDIYREKKKLIASLAQYGINMLTCTHWWQPHLSARDCFFSSELKKKWRSHFFFGGGAVVWRKNKEGGGGASGLGMGCQGQGVSTDKLNKAYIWISRPYTANKCPLALQCTKQTESQGSTVTELHVHEAVQTRTIQTEYDFTAIIITCWLAWICFVLLLLPALCKKLYWFPSQSHQSIAIIWNCPYFNILKTDFPRKC